MKRIVLAASAAAALALMAAPAFAADSVLAGTVTAICTVAAAPSEAVSLTAGTNLSPLSIQCNAPGGFTLAVSSAKGGQFAHSNASIKDHYNYKLAIPGLFGATSLATTKTVSSAGASGPFSARLPDFVSGPANFPMSVSDVVLDGKPFAGTYSDTVTFAITAN